MRARSRMLANMRIEPAEIDRALEELLGVVKRVPGVPDELGSSALEYFHGFVPTQFDDESRRATRRHLEWFLLERPSATLGGVPVEWALHRFTDLEVVELTEDLLRALLSSRCSVFQITGIAQGEGAWVRDLAALGEYPLSEPEGSRALESDDLIVGRLFAIGEALYRVSPAAGVFRSQKLLTALTRDFESLRKARRGVLRLSQAEIEAMFWQRVDLATEDAPDSARAFLERAGVAAEEIRSIFEALSNTPFDPSAVLLGSGDVLAAILERLAFDTDIDLELARRLLLAAWPVLAKGHGAEAANASAPIDAGPKDVRTAIDAFDRGRREGRDLDALFRQLELDLELEPETYDPDAIDGAPAPDFPGVVGAMVEEFLWETERTRGSAASAECQVVRAFAEFGQDYGVFENLGARELVLFASIWLAERRVLRTPAEARAMLSALREFCSWAQETQGVALLDAYVESLVPLEESLPRLVEANRWCAPDSNSGSEMFDVSSCAGSCVALRDHSGSEFEIELDPRMVAALRSGDRVRAARRSSGACEVYRCYPEQSARIAP